MGADAAYIQVVPALDSTLPKWLIAKEQRTDTNAGTATESDDCHWAGVAHNKEFLNPKTWTWPTRGPIHQVSK